MYVEHVRHLNAPPEMTVEGILCDEVMLKLPVESVGSDDQGLIEIAVSRGDGKLAKAFVTIQKTSYGVKFRLVTKKQEFSEETKVTATATFGTPVFRG